MLTSTAGTTAQLSRWWNYTAGNAIVSSQIYLAYPVYPGNNSLSYVGPDSSNRPVFFFPYANASGNLRATLFRINDDGSITEGTEQSAGVQPVAGGVMCTSEYEGANSFGNGTPANYVYLSWLSSPSYAFNWGMVATVNQDALTCTFGTVTAATVNAISSYPVVAYVGSNTAVFGSNPNDNAGVKIRSATRAGNVLTVTGNISAAQDIRIDALQVGFAPSGTQLRSAFFSTRDQSIGNVGNVIYGATELDTTNYTSFGSARIANSVDGQACNLNNTDSMLGIYLNVGNIQAGTGTLKALAVPITWNANANATFSAGNSVTVAALSSSAGYYVVSGATANTATIMLTDTSSSITYIPVTVSSGNVVSLGGAAKLVTGLSNIGTLPTNEAKMYASSAKIGTKTYLAGIQQRTSTAPYIFAARLS